MLDKAVVATSTDVSDKPIVEWAEQTGTPCSRGSLHDVLDRYCEAANEHNADIVVCVTSDCSLINPHVVDLVIASYLATRPPVEYASNTLECTYPRGLDVEVLSRVALEKAAVEAKYPSDREHVTPYMCNHPTEFCLLSVTCKGDYSKHRWTMDTPEDLEFVRQIVRRLDSNVFRWHEVINLLEQEPELCVINSKIEQKSCR
jgi:spore coat polysaccharide biosynthesis protein SpsF